jgi:hypothetical protein
LFPDTAVQRDPNQYVNDTVNSTTEFGNTMFTPTQTAATSLTFGEASYMQEMRAGNYLSLPETIT